MVSDMEKKYPRIYHRHFRKPMAHPGGAIAHDGDCCIYRLFRICTCGLHHELMCIPDDAEKIYPKYWEEQDGKAKIDMLMNIEAQDGHLWVNCDECKGEGGMGSIPCGECKGKGVIPFKMPDPVSDEDMAKIMEDMRKNFGEPKGKKND